jgi:uncharacterized protein with ParB-like and HNH nuclease domain
MRKTIAAEGSLIEFIRLGQIGVPDVQRPFIWPNAKVRDLFDSMYPGYRGWLSAILARRLR